MFLGFSERHSSQVPLVLNVTTGKISPQQIQDSAFSLKGCVSCATMEKCTEAWIQMFP